MNARKIWLLGTMIAAGLTASLRAATVTATIDPADISLGDSTQLTVTVSGGANQPAVPQIDGLEIMGVGESTQIEVVNGSVTQNSSRTYSITPQRMGTFTIPALQSGGAKSQPLTLRVGQGAAGGSPAPSLPAPQVAPGSGPVVIPPGAVSTAPPSPGETGPVEQGKYGSIEVTLPKKEFYEGELVPAEIRVLITAEAQIGDVGEPTISSDGFLVTPVTLKQAEQSGERINGHPYHVLTWRTTLTAIKPGNFKLNRNMPVVVIVQQRMPDMNDPDAIDNFMRNAFAAMQGVRKEIKLTGSTEDLTVSPLPQAGRPADFSGAVGLFEVEASASPTHVNAGDPVTLKLTISGHGNFDRVSSDMLQGDANWKTYSTKTKFEGQDSVGYAGAKTFEQPIIPQNGSITSVPSLSFSYFDPDKKQYVTCTTPPIPISVSGAAAPASAPAPGPVGTPSVAAANPAAPAPAPAAAGPDLRINRIEPGDFVRTLEPVYLSPLFLAGQALPLVALLGGLAFLRHRQRVSAPDRARLSAAQAAIREQLAAMDAAMRGQQAGAFFVHARNALQQRFGQKWNIRPEAITVADLDARLGGEAANARTIFEMADQASYSDLHLDNADLRQWRQAVVNELAETKR